ncbi:hypothetical protein [Acinetobacter oleivorans]|uniref:hypothetical protein n=1 Tax=Acinetobacter oleivorans TaxID=1148157 RepID=UPI000DCFD4D2|nr:hypothetical protein [Acinetobacter oleivorans]
MRKTLTLIILGSAFLAGCGNASESTKQTEVKTETQAPKKLSAKDQQILDKHNDYVQKYSLESPEVLKKRMKELLPEINAMEDQGKREMLQMNVYLAAQMYDEALALTDKQIARKPENPALYIAKCHILNIQQKDKHLITQCFDDAAFILKAQLDKPENKADPDYKQGEFTYLLAKYKGGHPEYKEKMQKYIDGTQDEKLKTSFKTIYEVEVGN